MKCSTCQLNYDICECGSTEESLARIATSLEEIKIILMSTLTKTQKEKVEKEIREELE